MRKVLVLFGGISPEHEVSRWSAGSVLENIDRTKNEVVTVGITKDGRWLYTQAGAKDIKSGDWESCENYPATISFDRGSGQLLVFKDDKTKHYAIDVVFPVLHGENGEDGRMQGLLELAGIPFVGPGMRASTNSMDKATTKVILNAAGIRQAACLVFCTAGYDEQSMIAQVESKFSYPVFIKPSATGSSCGVSKVKNRTSLITAINEAFKYDAKVLVEEFIEGREIEVAVLGKDNPQASVCGEIVPGNEFYDYNAKYIDDNSLLYIPADLPQEQSEVIRKTAVKVFTALECIGMSRVDFFALKDGGAVLNEINTIPGFTSISMYPKLIMHTFGMSYCELIEKLLELAEN